MKPERQARIPGRFGTTHDTVVLPPPEARIESAAEWPEPGSGAFGLFPAL